MSHPTTDPSIAPQPIDPLHDIDARTTTLWLVFASIGIFISLWLLAVVFNFAADESRRQKIDLAPTTELQNLRAWESSKIGEPATSLKDPGYEQLRAAMKKYSAQ